MMSTVACVCMSPLKRMYVAFVKCANKHILEPCDPFKAMWFWLLEISEEIGVFSGGRTPAGSLSDLRPVMFSVFRERLGPVEGPQLGLEQGPVRKTPPLLIETTQFSLSVTPSLFLFQEQRRGTEAKL